MTIGNRPERGSYLKLRTLDGDPAIGDPTPEAAREAIVPGKSEKGNRRRSLHKEDAVKNDPKRKTLWGDLLEDSWKRVFQSPSIGFFCWGSQE